jgi:hypothetical protein
MSDIEDAYREASAGICDVWCTCVRVHGVYLCCVAGRVFVVWAARVSMSVCPCTWSRCPCMQCKGM